MKDINLKEETILSNKRIALMKQLQKIENKIVQYNKYNKTKQEDNYIKYSRLRNNKENQDEVVFYYRLSLTPEERKLSKVKYGVEF